MIPNTENWLHGAQLEITGYLVEEVPHAFPRDIKKKLIEEAMREHGAVEMHYGPHLEGFGAFLPLEVTDDEVVCRMLEPYATHPKKKYKLEKILLSRYLPIVQGNFVNENYRAIADTLGKEAFLNKLDYLDDDGVYRSVEFKKILPLRMDEKFFYFKLGSKEHRIRLKWLHEISFTDEF